MLEITVREKEEITILTLVGKLVGGETLILLKDKVRQNLFNEKKRFILNLKGVIQIDQHGINEILLAYTTLHHRRGQLKISGLPLNFEKFVLANTDGIEIFKNDEEAIASFPIPVL